MKLYCETPKSTFLAFEWNTSTETMKLMWNALFPVQFARFENYSFKTQTLSAFDLFSKLLNKVSKNIQLMFN